MTIHLVMDVMTHLILLSHAMLEKIILQINILMVIH